MSYSRRRPLAGPASISMSWPRCPGGILALALAMLAAPVAAGEVELALQAGVALPFYSQSFHLDPSVVAPPGGPLQTSGSFDLDATGGLGWAASLAWRFAGPLGLEGRLDSAAIQLEFTGGQFASDLGVLIPGLPSVPISGAVSGDSELDRLIPVSLNLQYASRGRVQFSISGGISYLPATTLVATAGIRLQADALPGLPSLPFADLGLTAAATLESSVGANLGVGLRFALNPSAAFVLEGRAFGFPERELEWRRGDQSASPIEAALADTLDPIRFRPGFFQVTGGVALTF